MSEPIIVALDHLDGHAGLIDIATRMARLLDETLVLASVVVGPAFESRSPIVGSTGDDPARIRANRKRTVDAIADRLPDDIVCATAVVGAASVHAGLEALAGDYGAGLIVLGASHRATAERFLDGDPSVDLARHAPCAVLIAPQEHQAADVSRASYVSSIGVAWNRSPAATEALAVAADLAARADCQLRLVNVLEPEVALFMPPADPPIGKEFERQRRQETGADMTRAAKEVAPNLAIDCDVRDGHVADQLRAVSGELDLLVVGARRLGPVHRLTGSSVSEHFLHRALCPLLVIPRGARFPAVPHARA